MFEQFRDDLYTSDDDIAHIPTVNDQRIFTIRFPKLFRIKFNSKEIMLMIISHHYIIQLRDGGVEFVYIRKKMIGIVFYFLALYECKRIPLIINLQS